MEYRWSDEITPEFIEHIWATGDKRLIGELDQRLPGPRGNPFYYFVPMKDDSPIANGGQRAFIEDDFKGWKVAFGGNGAGKTRTASWACANTVLNVEPPRPRSKFFVYSKNRKIVADIWRDYIEPFLAPFRVIKKIKWADKARGYIESVELKTRSLLGTWELQFYSYDQGPEALVHGSFDGCWLDEPCPEGVWTEIGARGRECRLSGVKFYTLTPVNCYLPQLREHYEKRHTRESRVFKFYHFDTRHNIYLDPDNIAELDELYSDDIKATRFLGMFSNPEGAVFQEWDQTIHVVPRFDIKPHWRKFRTIDPSGGGNSPFVCLWFAVDDDGRFIFYKEWTTNKPMLVQDKARAIKDCEPEWGSDSSYESTFIDPEDLQQRIELNKHGISCVPARKGADSVHNGIELIRTMLRTTNGKKPQIVVFENCKVLRQQMPSYEWLPKPTGGRNPLKNWKPEPRHVNCDCIDAMRYGITMVNHSPKIWTPLRAPKRENTLYQHRG